MDSMGRLPARTLPHAARTSRGLRLGFGTVVLMRLLDAVTRPLAATMLLDFRVAPLVLKRQYLPPSRVSSPGLASLWQNHWALNAPTLQLSPGRHRDLDFDPW